MFMSRFFADGQMRLTADPGLGGPLGVVGDDRRTLGGLCISDMYHSAHRSTWSVRRAAPPGARREEARGGGGRRPDLGPVSPGVGPGNDSYGPVSPGLTPINNSYSPVRPGVTPISNSYGPVSPGVTPISNSYGAVSPAATPINNSYKLKFGIERILAKEPPKPCRPAALRDDGLCQCTGREVVCLTCRAFSHGAPSSSRGPHTTPPRHLHDPRLPPGTSTSQHQAHQVFIYRAADFPGPYSVLACDGSQHNQSATSPSHASGGGSSGKRKRSWSRAVFSHLQRKGLEKRFEVQKYVTKPDRRQLAGLLGLTDAQVKVWFQNRRMKWRHAEEAKRKRDESEQHDDVTAWVGPDRGPERDQREAGNSSDSDIEVTDSPH